MLFRSLSGDMNVTPRKEFLYYFHKNALEAVRIYNWKYIFTHPSRSYENNEPGRNGFPGKTSEIMVGEALYDLRRDPGERYDVKSYNPEIVKELKALADRARADLGDDLQNESGKNRREPGRVE